MSSSARSARINPESQGNISRRMAAPQRLSNEEIDRQSEDPTPQTVERKHVDKNNSNADVIKWAWKTFVVKFKAKTDIIDIGDLDDFGVMYPIMFFYIFVFLSILIANFFYSYTTGTGEKFLTPKDPMMPDDPYCTSKLKTITTRVSIDINGNWEGVSDYDPGKVAYQVSTVGLQATNYEWDKIVDAFEEDLARVTKLREEKQQESDGRIDKALEVLIPGSYNFHKQIENGFIDISVVGDARYLFDAQEHDTSIVQFTQTKKIPADPNRPFIENSVDTINAHLIRTAYSSGSGRLTITIPCRVDPKDKKRKINFKHGDMECREKTATISVDMRSASTALAVNDGLITLAQLTKMGIATYESSYQNHGLYVDESYIGMDPILCKEANVTKPNDATICYVDLLMPQLRGLKTWALPLFNEEEAYGETLPSNTDRLSKPSKTCWYMSKTGGGAQDNFRRFDVTYRKESIDTQLFIGFYFAYLSDYTFSRVKGGRVNLPTGYGLGWSNQGNDGQDYDFTLMTDSINEMRNLKQNSDNANLMDINYFYHAMAATSEMGYVLKSINGETFSDFVALKSGGSFPPLSTTYNTPIFTEDEKYMQREYAKIERYINDPVNGFNKYYSDCRNLEYFDHWGINGTSNSDMTSKYTGWLRGVANNLISFNCPESYEAVIRDTFKFATKPNNNGAWRDELDSHVLITTRMYHQNGFNLGKSSFRSRSEVGEYHFPDAINGLRTPPESLGDAFETCVSPPSVVALNSFGVASSNAALLGDNVFFVLLMIVMFTFNKFVVKHPTKTLVFPLDKCNLYGQATTLAIRRIIAASPVLANDPELKKVIRIMSLYRNDGDDHEETYEHLLEALADKGVIVSKQQLMDDESVCGQDYNDQVKEKDPTPSHKKSNESSQVSKGKPYEKEVETAESLDDV